MALSAKAWRKWLIRLAGSVTILGLLFWFLPLDQVIEGIGRVPLAMFLGVWVIFLVGHVVAAAKWWLLIGRGIRFGHALKAHFAGLAANLALPGVAGGDAARMGLVWRAVADQGRLAAGSFSDRLIDLMALGCLALAGLAFAGAEGHAAAVAARALVLVVAIFGVSVWGMPRVLPAIWARFPALPGRGFIDKASTAMVDLGRKPGLLASVLALSVVIQGSFIILAYHLALAAGVQVSVAAWAFAWAVAKLIVVLPVSLGGLGVREAALAGLLAPFGAAAPVVLAAGLVWQAVLWLAGGLGALVLIATGTGLGARPTATAGNGQ